MLPILWCCIMFMSRIIQFLIYKSELFLAFATSSNKIGMAKLQE